MSSHYSANQYDGAFKSQRLQNWCQPKPVTERPSRQQGHTTLIADDRGHLLPKVVKRGSAWPDFKGTWDLPGRIPAHHINPTGRSVEGLKRLKTWGFDPLPHTGSQPPDGLQDVSQTNAGELQGGAATSPLPPSTAGAELAAPKRPVTAGQRTASLSQDSKAALVPPVAQLAEDNQATEDTGKDRLHSQCPATEERQAWSPVTAEGTSIRPSTSKASPVSHVAGAS